MKNVKYKSHEDRNKEKLKLYKQGLNDSAIADKLGLSQSAVSAWRRKKGLPINKRKRTLRDNRVELYKQGLTDKEIAAKIGISTGAISIWRRRRGWSPNKSKK